MTKTHTSFRMDQLVLDVLTAWQVHLTTKRRRLVSRTEVIEQMVSKVPPPSDDTPEAQALRDAHRRLVDALTD